MIPFFVVLMAVCLGTAPDAAPVQDGEELRLRPIGTTTGPDASAPLTGLDRSKMTARSGWRATGERAREFALSTLAEERSLGDDERMPSTSGKPWLILIGPRPETDQVVGQIPEELRPLIEVRQYTPDDKRLDREMKQYYTGGTYALVLRSNGDVYWNDLASIAEILRQINRLLGREPEPPWPIPIPLPSPLNPFRPAPPGPGGPPVLAWFIGGLAAGLVLRSLLVAGLRLILRAAREQLRALAAEVAAPAQPTPAPPASPPAPNG